MPSARYKRCIFFLADGARADVTRELLAAGELPNIARYLTETGTNGQATTVFPSTTGPAYLPFLTGRYPGPCNLPGIRWFDREQYAHASPFTMRRTRSYCGPAGWMINRDLAPGVPTVFELANKPFNLHNPITRGLSRSRKRLHLGVVQGFRHIVSHYFGDHGAMHEIIVRVLRQVVCEDFDFIFTSFPRPDHMGHYYRPRSERTLAAYREVDEAIGMVGRLLERLGWRDDTLLFLSADHGMTETHDHFEVSGFLDQKGFRTYRHPGVLRYWTSADAACMVSGNSMAHLYFRNAKGWAHPTPFEEVDGGLHGTLVDDLLGNEAIALVAGRDSEGAVRVRSRRGEAAISRRADGGLSYQPTKRGDPFGYANLPQNLSNRAALEETFGTDYPDAPMQLLQIFDSARTGDLVVCASDGYDLRVKHEYREHKASHGALTRHQMLVPFLTNHRLPAHEAFRTVDFFPTAFSLLDWELPPQVDGIDLSLPRTKEEAA